MKGQPVRTTSRSLPTKPASRERGWARIGFSAWAVWLPIGVVCVDAGTGERTQRSAPRDRFFQWPCGGWRDGSAPSSGLRPPSPPGGEGSDPNPRVPECWAGVGAGRSLRGCRGRERRSAPTRPPVRDRKSPQPYIPQWLASVGVWSAGRKSRAGLVACSPPKFPSCRRKSLRRMDWSGNFSTPFGVERIFPQSHAARRSARVGRVEWSIEGAAWGGSSVPVGALVLFGTPCSQGSVHNIASRPPHCGKRQPHILPRRKTAFQTRNDSRRLQARSVSLPSRWRSLRHRQSTDPIPLAAWSSLQRAVPCCPEWNLALFVCFQKKQEFVSRCDPLCFVS